jgi:hypothetical protein
VAWAFGWLTLLNGRVDLQILCLMWLALEDVAVLVASEVKPQKYREQPQVTPEVIHPIMLSLSLLEMFHNTV